MSFRVLWETWPSSWQTHTEQPVQNSDSSDDWLQIQNKIFKYCVLKNKCGRSHFHFMKHARTLLLLLPPLLFLLGVSQGVAQTWEASSPQWECANPAHVSQMSRSIREASALICRLSVTWEIYPPPLSLEIIHVSVPPHQITLQKPLVISPQSEIFPHILGAPQH